jgi:hypothetical protein
VVVHPDRKALELWARELGSVGISFAPGTTGIYGGRPKPTPQIRLFTLFIDKTALPAPTVVMQGQTFSVDIPKGAPFEAVPPDAIAPEAPFEGETVQVPLIRLALARSGDKADSSNIAIIARDPGFVPILRREVTSERMAEHFKDLVGGPVRRFEAPGLNAFNFLLDDALGGGGMASLRIDPQGKAYGQMALEMMIPVPVGLLPA